MSVGELVSALKAIPLLTDRGQKKTVYYDFAFLHPTLQIGSYRGDYGQLSMGYSHDSHAPELDVLIEALDKASISTFTGWKGGEFDMSPSTPIWAANRGESGSQAIVGVKDDGWAVLILTQKMDT